MSTFAFSIARSRPIEWLDLHVAELDPVAFGFQADITAGDRAVVPLGGDGSVDPEGHVPALAGDLESIPLAGRLDARAALLLRQVDPLELAGERRIAEEEASRAIAGLGLVPDPRIRRVAGVDARIVAPLARDRREPPLDMEDEVAQLVVPPEPLMAAVPLADEMAAAGTPT
jgi:hypothetical protein